MAAFKNSPQRDGEVENSECQGGTKPSNYEGNKVVVKAVKANDNHLTVVDLTNSVKDENENIRETSPV